MHRLAVLHLTCLPCHPGREKDIFEPLQKLIRKSRRRLHNPELVTCFECCNRRPYRPWASNF